MSLPDDLPPPDDIEAVVFDVGGESYALLSFALPELELPRGLTAAEQRVIEGLLAGCSVIEIAHDRGTSPRTVNNQIAAVYAKVGVSCRAELVELCVRPAHEGERPSRTTLPGIPTETKQVG